MNSLKRRSDFTILLRVSLMLTTLLFSIGIKAQTDYPKVNFNYFGHVQIDLEMIENLQKNGTFNHASYANLGEQDLFVNAQINKRISFLGETVVRPDLKSSSFFIPSIERAQLKFDYFRNHSFLIGKFHTPVNFWNDTYHHGRLFFPVIDRPVMFSYLIPLHTLGVRLQGQNLGALRFGYDMVLGNGISSNDTKDLDMHKSITLAAHIKPRDGLRIGLSYYEDVIKGNYSGVHSGHIGASHVAQSSSYNYYLFLLRGFPTGLNCFMSYRLIEQKVTPWALPETGVRLFMRDTELIIWYHLLCLTTLIYLKKIYTSNLW
jgi:hypothetical protein